jgi:hypothetical protein
MAKVTSLSRARKERARAEARRKADANAAKFGRTKARKAQEATEAERAARSLDAHRRDDGE